MEEGVAGGGCLLRKKENELEIVTRKVTRPRNFLATDEKSSGARKGSWIKVALSIKVVFLAKNKLLQQLMTQANGQCFCM